MQNKFLYFLLFITLQSFAQKDGFWDKDRAYSKQITLGSGKRTAVHIEDLPTGTTEIVYRITLLDENQKIANSLVSILKAIPDPTGISQGSAGAVFLLSKTSGDDTCLYGIFTNQNATTNYIESGKFENSCFSQETPINKDAKRLSLKSSKCLNSDEMWFGFENKNWVMKARIVLEVVPWVDYKLNRGWNLENRKSILAICKSTELSKKIANSDNYCVCVLEKIQEKYSFAQYNALLAEEKTKLFRDAGVTCFSESGASKVIYDGQRTEAKVLFEKHKYSESIQKLIPIIADGKGKVADFNALATNYIFTKQYDKALKVLKEAEQLDDIELQTKLNLAHTYLLKNNYSQAKKIYKKYKSQNVNDSLSWSQKIKLDFEAFRKAGLPSKSFDNILNVIK